MKVFIVKIDYFDPCRWPVLSAPYLVNPKESEVDIVKLAHQLGEDGLAILVGSQNGRTRKHHKRKLLGMISCHMALYETRALVYHELVAPAHFTRRDGNFRMPYCIPISRLWVCQPPLKDALRACEDELVGDNRHAFFIELSSKQAEKATDMVRRLSGPPKDLPRPGPGFIRDI